MATTGLEKTLNALYALSGVPSDFLRRLRNYRILAIVRSADCFLAVCKQKGKYYLLRDEPPARVEITEEDAENAVSLASRGVRLRALNNEALRVVRGFASESTPLTLEDAREILRRLFNLPEPDSPRLLTILRDTETKPPLYFGAFERGGEHFLALGRKATGFFHATKVAKKELREALAHAGIEL